jgi:hypothetical protein
MAYNSISITQGTQTAIYTDNTGGTTSGTLIAVQKVDISPSGTAGTLWDGNVGVSNGTIATIGTLPNLPGGSIVVTSLPNLPQGSVQVTAGTGVVTSGTITNSGTTTGVGTISNIGSLGVLNAGTITTLPNIPGGTLNNVGTVPGIGTITNIGSISTIGTMPAISLALNSGTITTIAAGTQNTLGTIGTILGIGGTVQVSGASAGTYVNVSTGTVQSVGTIPGIGTLSNQGSLTNLGQVYNAGTVQNLLAGTITALQNGTISAGTINVGTFSLVPLAGSVLTTAVNIGTASGTAAIPTTTLSNRKAIIGYNVGTSTVYIGGTGVTTTSGIPIGTGQYTPSFDLGTAVLYGIAGAPGGTIIALEVS